MVYYHELVMENGDTGNCGRKEKYPEDISVGSEIEYDINDHKIKFMKRMVHGTLERTINLGH